MSDFSDDGGVYDGPDIRPPPSASAQRERERRQRMQQRTRESSSSSSSRSRGGRDGGTGNHHRDSSDRRGGGADRRPPSSRRQDERGARPQTSSSNRRGGADVDLRDRLSHGRQHQQQAHRGSDRRREHRPQPPLSSDARDKEERLRKFLLSESMKSSGSKSAAPARSTEEQEEIRRRRKEAEKNLLEYEDKVKRRRDRSAERGDSKRPKEEQEEEESGSEEDSDDDSDDDEESDSDDTASEQSGATPERIDSEEEEEEVVEEEEEVIEEEEEERRHRSHKKSKKHKKEKKSRHRQEEVEEELEEGEHVEEDEEDIEMEEIVNKKKKEKKDSDDEIDTHGRWRDEEDEMEKRRRLASEEDPDRTPERSPTPMRGENEPFRPSHPDNDDDDEDSQLEAALRGELREERDQDTPHSQGSFGDGAAAKDGGSQDEGKVNEKSAEEKERERLEMERSKLPPYLPSIYGCRSVEEFHCLNRIEEGTYGVVYRARDKKTKEIVALKRLKMEREKEGFPITSLREINTLLISQHVNVVTVREIVVGSNMDKIYIVMDFVEHDLKALMETMRRKRQVFTVGEVKCLLTQLLKAIAHLHDNWILHRDLKTSNLLLSHNGILKVGDFGLAREYGSPIKPYTPIVVTLWYRAPELLLGQKEYSTHIDVWSCGCIFGELLQMEPLFRGEGDIDQLHKIYKLLGTPSERVWPKMKDLPGVQRAKFVDYPISNLRSKFPHAMLSEEGMDLFKMLLTYDPVKRLSCEKALQHPYFGEQPTAIDPSMFPTWPAKSEQSAGDWALHKKVASPKPPSGGGMYKQMNEDKIEAQAGGKEGAAVGAPGTKDDGFSFVNRNQTSVLPNWELKF